MSTKPKGIRWLEEQTEQAIAHSEPDAAEAAPHDRHLSVRLPAELAADVAEVRRRLAG